MHAIDNQMVGLGLHTALLRSVCQPAAAFANNRAALSMHPPLALPGCHTDALGNLLSSRDQPHRLWCALKSCNFPISGCLM